MGFIVIWMDNWSFNNPGRSQTGFAGSDETEMQNPSSLALVEVSETFKELYGLVTFLQRPMQTHFDPIRAWVGLETWEIINHTHFFDPNTHFTVVWSGQGWKIFKNTLKDQFQVLRNFLKHPKFWMSTKSGFGKDSQHLKLEIGSRFEAGHGNIFEHSLFLKWSVTVFIKGSKIWCKAGVGKVFQYLLSIFKI